MATYRAGLEQDPENEEMKEGIQKCIEQINKAGRGQLSDEELKERQQKAMADPEIQMILQDPIMRQARFLPSALRCAARWLQPCSRRCAERRCGWAEGKPCAQVLNDFSTDPKAAARHSSNPAIMANIQKLVNAGIVQIR